QADAGGLRRAYERAGSRDVTPAVYTHQLFATDHDEANRAAVAGGAAEDLDLVGIALRAERKTVDKIVDRLRFHPCHEAFDSASWAGVWRLVGWGEGGR